MGSPSNKLGTSTVTGHTISRSCWLVNKASCYTYTQHAFVVILEYISVADPGFPIGGH